MYNANYVSALVTKYMKERIGYFEEDDLLSFSFFVLSEYKQPASHSLKSELFDGLKVFCP